MLEFLAAGLLLVVALVLALGALVLVPLMILGLFFKVLIQLVALPFRILGWMVAGAAGVLAVLLKAFVAFMLLVGGLLFLPLLPVIMAVGLVWLFVRLLRPRPAFG